MPGEKSRWDSIPKSIPESRRIRAWSEAERTARLRVIASPPTLRQWLSGMPEKLIHHRIEFRPADPSEKLRDSIGGHPYLPEGMDQPVCSCGERMSLYFQFDIREGFGLPFQTGSHLTVFACEAMSGHVPKSWEQGLPAKRKGRLPDNYWEMNHTDVARGQRYKDQPRFYRLMLHKPDVEHHFRPIEGV